MCPINQVLPVGVVVLKIRVWVQMISLYVDAELAVSNKVHKWLSNLGDRLLTVLVASVRVRYDVVLLLQVDHVWTGEYALELNNKLGDALICRLLLEEAKAGHSLVTRQSLSLILHISRSDRVEDGILAHQFFERLLCDFAFVNR